MPAEEPLDPVGEPQATVETLERMAKGGTTILSARFIHHSLEHYLEQIHALAELQSMTMSTNDELTYTAGTGNWAATSDVYRNDAIVRTAPPVLVKACRTGRGAQWTHRNPHRAQDSFADHQFGAA